jgi:hypothetical protein
MQIQDWMQVVDAVASLVFALVAFYEHELLSLSLF